MRDLLFLSNGHGEDTIAGRILDEVVAQRQGLSIDAWPMVGHGAAYRARSVPTLGSPNLLPSSGFATMEWRLMKADLKAGWIATHWNQYRYARQLPGRYRMLVAVGDIIPLVASVLSRTPFAFIGCAKSYYYNEKYGYTGFEKRLLRRHARAVYPRDSLTAGRLVADGLPVRDLGNPMMDGLEGTGDRLGVPEGATVVGMMAGTREDAEVNFIDLLPAAAAIAARHPEPSRLRIVFALRDAFDAAAMARRIATEQGLEATAKGAGDGVVLRAGLPGGAEVLGAKGRFADVLRLSSVVVGMAGTANEQAVGLGIPLVAVPARGIQGRNFVDMKMQYFGESAIAADREPEAIARAVLDILADPARAARMGAAGRERMGGPGASRAIAADILEALDGADRRERAA
jgi:uncharacterized protein (TIGR03492 family)